MPRPNCYMYDERAKLDVRHHGFMLLVERDEVRKRKNGEKQAVKRFRPVGLFPGRGAAHAELNKTYPNKKYRIQGVRLDHTPVWVPNKREKGDRE